MRGKLREMQGFQVNAAAEDAGEAGQHEAHLARRAIDAGHEVEYVLGVGGVADFRDVVVEEAIVAERGEVALPEVIGEDAGGSGGRFHGEE
jgi:hypothetical protein